MATSTHSMSDKAVPVRIVGDYNAIHWRLGRYMTEYNLRRGGTPYHPGFLSPDEPLPDLGRDCSSLARALADALDKESK